MADLPDVYRVKYGANGVFFDGGIITGWFMVEYQCRINVRLDGL
jgi:hypothetical protein